MSLSIDLQKLYRVDAQVRGLRSRLDSAQRYLTGQERQLEALSQQTVELKARSRQIQATIANLEVETQVVDERIEKLRNELNGASTNKQYTAVLTELNTVKESRSDFDDRELEQMDVLDDVKEQLTAIEAQRVEREKVREVAEAQLAQRNQDVGTRLAELEEERRLAAAPIPSADLAIFDEMADAFDGESMAAIEEIDRRRREYSCGACNMMMPFESVATLLSTTDTLVRCTACKRILFLEEETRGALVKK